MSLFNTESLNERPLTLNWTQFVDYRFNVCLLYLNVLCTYCKIKAKKTLFIYVGLYEYNNRLTYNKCTDVFKIYNRWKNQDNSLPTLSLRQYMCICTHSGTSGKMNVIGGDFRRLSSFK